MKSIRIAVVSAVAVLAASGALAQSTSTNEVQRNVNQQERIEQGLKSGSLNTREAAKLEREEAKINRMEANAMKDGTVTNKERARITREQNEASRDIYREKHDAQTGNPNSASSQRMQADVQRNVNQQERIKQGMESGQLTNQEAARMERGQARVERKEARAGADGHVGAREQHRIQTAENHQSRRIFRQKHDGQTR